MDSKGAVRKCMRDRGGPGRKVRQEVQCVGVYNHFAVVFGITSRLRKAFASRARFYLEDTK